METYPSPQAIQVGVIGYGGAFNMGRVHLEEMKKAGMTPCAVTELDPLRLQAAKTDFPEIKTFTSVAEMLEQSNVDLVTIITPHNTHAPLALQCLESRRHVICEKPLAITTEECDTIIAVAKQNGLMASTYHNRHWDGWIMRAVEKINRERILGEVFRIDARMGQRSVPLDWWRSSRTISGGILYDWGVHLLEYALQIIPSEVTEVSGFAQHGHWAQNNGWKDDTIEDEACAIVRFRNGAWLNLTITHLNANPQPGFLEIHGTKGNYVIDGDNYTWYQNEGEIRTVQTGKSGPSEWFQFYKNIAQYLTGAEPLVITAEWARRPIHILDLAVKSAKEGRTLQAQDDWKFSK